MLGRFRVFVSLSAALPVALADGQSRSGEPVYNFRATAETGHFLGHLFRTLGQVLKLTDNGSANDGQVVERGTKEMDKKRGGCSSRKTTHEKGGKTRRGTGRRRDPMMSDKKFAATTETLSAKKPQTKPSGRRRHYAQTSSEHKAMTLDYRNRLKPGEPHALEIRSTAGSLQFYRDLMTFSSGANGSRTRWDQAASTLLEVSLAFVDNISQSVIDEESNAYIVSKLFELTSRETVASNFKDPNSVVNWTCTIALHLMKLKRKKHQRPQIQDQKELKL